MCSPDVSFVRARIHNFVSSLMHIYFLPFSFFFVIVMSREGTSYYVTPNKINAHDDDTAACIYPIHMAVAVHACTPVHVHEASYIYGHAGRMDDG